MTNKPCNTSTIATHHRCEHRFANGMRCGTPISNPDVLYCSRHSKLVQNEPIEQDLSEFILKGSQDFQTAQGVNFSLANIFELLAKNRITARRAAVLAYIGSLLLRTHAAIDADREANITDPTAKPKPSAWPAEAPDPDPTKKPS